jgi:TPR repeat protein
MRKIIIVLISLFIFNAIGQTKDQIRGEIESGNFDIARQLAQQLIKKNDPVGYFTIGWLEERKKTKEGFTKAFLAYQKAATLGDLYSTFLVAKMFQDGVGVPKNIDSAIIWYEIAVKKNDVESIFELANIYRNLDGHPGNLQKSYDLFLKIAQNNSIENTELSVLSFFFIGLMTRDSVIDSEKSNSEYIFNLVLKSPIKTPRVEWAKSEIKSYVTSGKSRAGLGDSSPDDILCASYGFEFGKADYADCRLKLELIRQQNVQADRIYGEQLRQYQLEQKRYQEQVARYEKERERQKALAQIQFGLALLGGTSPNASENFSNAGRAMLGMPPLAPSQPAIQNFTITNSHGKMTNCTIITNNINCF